MVISHSATVYEKWSSCDSTNAKLLPPRNHHCYNSINYKVSSLDHLHQVTLPITPINVIKSMHPCCMKVRYTTDLSSMHQILQSCYNMNSLVRATISCLHDLHESSPPNISTRMQVSASKVPTRCFRSSCSRNVLIDFSQIQSVHGLVVQ